MHINGFAFSWKGRTVHRVRAASGAESPAYRVDDLILDVGQRRVLRGDDEIRLPALSFDLLLALTRAAPNMVSYDELLERVWPSVVVNPETIGQRVKLVRDALGDDPGSPRYIAGVRGRGYRVICTVESLPPPAAAVSPVQETVTAVAQPAPAPAAPVWHGQLAAAAAAGVIAIIALAAFVISQRDVPRADATATRGANVQAAVAPQSERPERTIAVLPFANIGGDPENEYFSDGLTDEVLSRLARIPELRVVGRTSSFHFKGKTDDIKKIGETLGVRHLLEGSVRRQGVHVRVTAQLVDVTNGFRVWSDAFDRQLVDALAIQDDIAHAVVENLQITLTAPEDSQPPAHTPQPEVLDLYLRGKHIYQNSWTPERIRQAIDHFGEALRIDPEFTAAYVLKADAIQALSIVGGSLPDGENPSREELLRRALELDPGNADAISSLGNVLSERWDFAGAERELHRAEAINPNGELVLRNLTWYYMSVGMPAERGIDYALRAVALDPLNTFVTMNLAQAYYYSGHYAEALAAADRTVELDPNYWPGHIFRYATLSGLQRYDEAIEALNKSLELGAPESLRTQLFFVYSDMGRKEDAEQLFERYFSGPEAAGFRGTPLAMMGRYEEALADLEVSYRAREPTLGNALTDPQWIPLEDDPRFQRIVHALHVEERVEWAHRMALANPKYAKYAKYPKYVRKE